MSRYRALRGDSHNPTASAVINAKTRNKGNTSTPQPGAIPNQASIARRTRNDTKKSTRGDETEAKGIIRRGNKTFFSGFDSLQSCFHCGQRVWESSFKGG